MLDNVGVVGSAEIFSHADTRRVRHVLDPDAFLAGERNAKERRIFLRILIRDRQRVQNFVHFMSFLERISFDKQSTKMGLKFIKHTNLEGFLKTRLNDTVDKRLNFLDAINKNLNHFNTCYLD